MAILKQYRPGENLTAENANAWEAATRSVAPQLDSTHNFHNPEGRYDVIVRKNFSDIDLEVPPFSAMWAIRGNATDTYSYSLTPFGLYSNAQPTYLTPVIIGPDGIKAGEVYGWASLALSPVYAAIEPIDGETHYPCMQFGIDDSKFGLVKHKEGFYCVSDNPDLVVNGVKVVRVVRKPIYPTFIAGAADGMGFDTTEVVLTNVAQLAFYNIENNTGKQQPFLKRYYSVTFELSQLFFTNVGSPAVQYVDITPYKVKGTTKTQIGNVARLYSIQSVVSPQIGTNGCYTITFTELLDIDEYLTLGVRGTVPGFFSYKVKSIFGG